MYLIFYLRIANISKASKIGKNLMVSTNVSFVHVVLLLVPVIGGIQKDIWAQLYSCKHTDGSLIPETNSPKKGFNT